MDRADRLVSCLRDVDEGAFFVCISFLLLRRSGHLDLNTNRSGARQSVGCECGPVTVAREPNVADVVCH